jgi:hypothetical protein
MKTFICSQCKNEKPMPEGSGGTGYATDNNGNKICYACCGENDLKALQQSKPGERFVHYLSSGMVTNWPGTLKIKPDHSRQSRHNIAGTRLDVWFTVNSQRFHGVQYGSNSQILRITRVK